MLINISLLKNFNRRILYKDWVQSCTGITIGFILILSYDISEDLYYRVDQRHTDNQTKSGICWPVSKPGQMAKN